MRRPPGGDLANGDRANATVGGADRGARRRGAGLDEDGPGRARRARWRACLRQEGVGRVVERDRDLVAQGVSAVGVLQHLDLTGDTAPGGRRQVEAKLAVNEEERVLDDRDEVASPGARVRYLSGVNITPLIGPIRVRDKGRSFAGRAASDLKFLFVDYPECQPDKNSEVKGMLDEYQAIAASLVSATVTEEGKALRSEIVRNILSTSNEALKADFGIEILDLHFKYLNYSPQVHQEITDKITKDRGRDIARYNKLGNACTGTIRQVKEQQLGAIVGERDRRVRELEGEAVAQSIAIKAHAFNEGPGFFRFLKMLELYEESLSSNTSFVLAADNPLLALMSDPSLVRTVSKRKLAARPVAKPAPQPSTPPATEAAKQP